MKEVKYSNEQELTLLCKRTFLWILDDLKRHYYVMKMCFVYYMVLNDVCVWGMEQEAYG